MGDEVFDILGRLRIDTSEAERIPADLRNASRRSQINLQTRVDTSRAKSQFKDLESRSRETKAQIERAAKPRVDTSQAKRELAGLETQAKGLRAFFEGRNAGGGGIEGLASGSFGKMAGIAGLAGGIAGLAAYAAPMVIQAGSGTIGAAMQKGKLERTLQLGYGGGSAAFVQASEELEKQTGFLAADFMRAALIGKTLVANYGLQNEQVAKLISVSADLAATSPYEDIQTSANAMERLQSAIRGEAEASERLGLTLNDTYMKNIAFGGSLRSTWETLSDAEKAQYRYKEILNQTNDVLGAAQENNLATNARQASAALKEASLALGEKLIPVLSKLVGILAQVPSGVYEGIAYTAMAGGAAMLGRGAYRMGKGLLGKGTGRVVAEAASEVAAEAAAAGAAKATARKAGQKIAKEVAEEAAEGIVTGTAKTGLAAKIASLFAGIGGGGGALGAAATVAGAVAVPAAIAAAGTAIGLDAYKNHVASLEAQEQHLGRKMLSDRYVQQLKYGIDWGIYQDEQGNLKQGENMGWDRGAQNPIYATRNIGGRLQQYIVGYEESVAMNRYGAALGSPNTGAGAQYQTVQIVLQNQSSQPLKATDAQSYAPSNY